MARLSRRTLLRGGLGIAISLVAIWILVRAVDIEAAFEVLRSASPAWIAVMLCTVFLDIAARGVRWRVLLAPIAPLPYRRVLGYTYLGYLANNVLPARLGELYRSHALGEGEGVSRTTVLGTVVVERVVDTVMVVAIAAVAVLLLSARGEMSSAVLLGLAFVTLLVIALALGLAAHRLPGADRVAALIAKRPRLLELARRLRDGLSVAGRPRTLGLALLLSAFAWSASAATFWAAGQAVGIGLLPAQAALLSSGVALATIVPSGPGYLGTFELTAVGIAGSFGIPRDEAFAMALLVHAIILLVTSVGGVVAGVRLRVWHRGLGASERLVAATPGLATSSLATPGPATSSLETPGPATSSLETPGPATPGPAPSAPSASRSAASGPAASGPAASGPAASGPAASGPAASGPAATGPSEPTELTT